MKKLFIVMLMLWAMALASRAENLYRYASDSCPNRDSTCLTNLLHAMGTNYFTLVIDGGPWSITNGVVVPVNVELLYANDASFEYSGTNTVVIETRRKQNHWLSNIYIAVDAYISNRLTAIEATIVSNITVGGTGTFYKLVGDGSGVTGVYATAGISTLIDGTTNVVPGSITAPSLANSSIGNDALADGAVTELKIGADSVGTNQLIASGVTAGDYTNAFIRVDDDGRISLVSNGVSGAGGISTQDLASVLIVGNDAVGGSISNANAGVFTNNVNTRTMTATDAIIGSGRGVTNISGTNIVSGTVGSAALQSTAVTPGSYVAMNATVDADGRVTSASSINAGLLKFESGASGAGSATYTQEGPYSSDSGAYGPFTHVGFFSGWIEDDSASQVAVDIKMADDSGISVNVVVLQRITFKPDAAELMSLPFSVIVPSNKYMKVDITNGTPSYYIRYGSFDL